MLNLAGVEMTAHAGLAGFLRALVHQTVHAHAEVAGVVEQGVARDRGVEIRLAMAIGAVQGQRVAQLVFAAQHGHLGGVGIGGPIRRELVIALLGRGHLGHAGAMEKMPK